MSDARYPIGKFQYDVEITPSLVAEWIEEIASFPQRLCSVVTEMTDEQLDTPYREGGWTARQVVHHLADSHINIYTRFRLALTEENPTIRPYDEAKWAELADAKSLPVAVSLAMLQSLHERWIYLVNSLTPEELKRTFYHSELERTFTLEWCLGLYAWHGKHHLAHIRSVIGEPIES